VTSLTWDQVIAWRLRRSHLSRRSAPSKLTAVVSDMCGAHAQIMSTVGLALAARVSRLSQDTLDRAIIEKRTLVKTWAMRGTLHVFAAEDIPLYAAAQRTRDQYMNPAFLKYFNLVPADVESVLEAIPQALDGTTLTREELADQILRITKRSHLEERLRSGWGELLKPAAFRGLLCFGPQDGRSVTFVRPDQWIGHWRDYGTEEALEEAYRRFLSTYGPASRSEAARWMGVRPPQAGRVLKAMSDELVEVDVAGTPRLALAKDLRSLKSASPAEGIRLLPSFDQVLVMGAPHKEAIVDPRFAERLYRARIAVWSLPAVLVDGRAAAGWKLERKAKKSTLRVAPFGKLSRKVRSGLTDEAGRLEPLVGTPVELAVEA